MFQGMVVITPDYRKSTDEGGEFPAGIEDIYATLKWAYNNKAQLGISSEIILAGGSSGGNMAIAAAMLAKVSI